MVPCVGSLLRLHHEHLACHDDGQYDDQDIA